MLGARHEIARLQSDFYRDQFRKILRWIMYAMVIIFLLIAAIIYFILFQPKQSYYANTVDGKILAMPRNG
jgi:multisubunit Na+/H+ antiporter MnhB subunit